MLVVGIVGVLVVAWLIGQLLRLFVAGGASSSVIDNLNRRIRAWWVLAGLVGLAVYAGRGGVCLLFAVASLAALHEFMTAGLPDRPSRRLLLGGYLVVALQYLFVWTASAAAFIFALPLVGALSLLAAWAIGGRGGPPSGHGLRAGLLISVYGISYAPALVTLLPGRDGADDWRLLIFLLVVVQASDVLQYLWGKLAGRHPIAPRVSPSKTVEGSVGGLLCASALGALLAPITPFSREQAALIALLLVVLGFAGGLALSAVKRQRGIKDWGRLIPGHGGVLDRLDSLYLSAPVFYYLLRGGWAG
ncbi:MAG: phosphatidate cytidylyltransferase [Dokdonella sp.]|nr:MAG: phosphatidate cytidylyltransferase [Dokdonella sp.]